MKKLSYRRYRFLIDKLRASYSYSYIIKLYERHFITDHTRILDDLRLLKQTVNQHDYRDQNGLLSATECLNVYIKIKKSRLYRVL